MTMYVCAPSRVFFHIHYINSYLRCHFHICRYGIFPFLRCAKYYPRTMSAYDLCISFPYSFVSTLWRHFFVPFVFVSTLYPGLSLSISMLYLILPPPVSMLDSLADLHKYMAFKWFNQINPIGSMRSLMKPYCNLCMEELLSIIKKLYDKKCHTTEQKIGNIWSLPA